MPTTPTTVIVASHNPGKIQEMQSYLQTLPWQLQLLPESVQIQETGTTFRENARLKATQAAQATGAWSIADDSGLSVVALGGAPGIYSARYGKTDPDRIGRLLQALEGKSHRQAQFTCALALAKPDGTIVLETEGICSGEILLQPQGGGGFGYDPIFYVPEQQLTFAEMSAAQKHQVSHRGRAFQQLLAQLEVREWVNLLEVG